MSQIYDMSAVDLVAKTRTGELTAAEVLEAHLDRINEHNGKINAVVDLNVESARAQAQALDGLPPEQRGRLHGLPVAIKDTANAFGFTTTMGHKHFEHFRPDHDDVHVARMRAEGVVIMGKTNIPEFAAGSHSFNKVYGTTTNPYDPTKAAGGSSGGAAAGLASGFFPIADGSDMGGSLRNPAAFCGIVGFRPTPGVLPNDETANMTERLVTVGPMARTAADVALLLDVMAGPSRRQPMHVALDHEALRDLVPTDLTGLRVAYSPDINGEIPVEPAIAEALDALAAKLESAGATVTRACPNIDGSDHAFRVNRSVEMQVGNGQLLADEPENFNDFLADNIRQGEKWSAVDVIAAQRTYTQLSREAADFFADYDIILAPTTQVLPFPAEWDWVHEINGQQMGDYLEWMRSTWLFTPLGIPAMSLPIGFAEVGLPIGAQLLAGPGKDVELLQVAAGIEVLIGDQHKDPWPSAEA